MSDTLHVTKHDVLTPPRGRLELAQYDGDVRRAKLTEAERRENALWVDEGRLWVPKDWDGGGLAAYGRWNQGKGAKLVHAGRGWTKQLRRAIKPHIGAILSEPFQLDVLFNLVTTVGKQLYLDRLFAMGGPPGQLTHMGVGNSATAATVGDTQLGGSSPAPDLRTFDALPTRSGLVVTSIRTYATGEGNMNWQEIAQFNGGTNGTSLMFNRIAPIGAFNKTSAVSIVATITTTAT